MFKLAFSTVACPDRTLEQAFKFAVECGYDGIELRTLGSNDPTLLCEPSLTGSEKIRRLAVSSGVELACLSTSFRFDAPVWPPVVGRALPSFAHRSRPAQRAVDAADDMECELVRVFGFEVGKRERRRSAVRRIAGALMPVLDSARARQVDVVLENGGSFQTADELMELFEACEQHPSLRAAYDLSVGQAAGDSIDDVLAKLGERLALLRLRSTDGDGQPKPMSHAEARTLVPTLVDARYAGWMSVDWPIAWMPELAERHGETSTVLANIADVLRGAMPEGTSRAVSHRVAVGV